MTRILVVEDDAELLEGLKDNLEVEGFVVTTASDGRQGLLEASRNRPDAVILDLMMPKLGGFDVCRALRQDGFAAPILILTALGREVDKIRGFELGADDYLTKPFSVNELLARVRAMLRRTSRASTDLHTYKFDNVVIDFATQQLWLGAKASPLSHLEVEVLSYFVTHRGRVIPREDLLTAVWGYKAFSTRAVDNLIGRLRQKIEVLPHQPRHILTIYGIGYKFVE